MTVLDRLQSETGLPLPPIIEAWNKADALPPERAEALEYSARGETEHPSVLVSALTGQGVEELLWLIEQMLLKGAKEIEVDLGPGDGKARAWLHRNGDVIAEQAQDNGNVHLVARLTQDRLGQFYAEFPALRPSTDG